MSPHSPPTIDDLNSWGIRFVIAIRWSIDSEKIKPMDWPARIVAALETGAVSDHFSGMISSVARKLQAAPVERQALLQRQFAALHATDQLLELGKRLFEREIFRRRCCANGGFGMR